MMHADDPRRRWLTSARAGSRNRQRRPTSLALIIPIAVEWPALRLLYSYMARGTVVNKRI